MAWWGEHEPGELSDALGRCRAGLATTIDAASPTEWIPLELHCAVIGALRERCGPEGFARAYVDACDHALRLPLFEGLIRPLVRIAGRRALIHGFPRGWGMIMRGCGHVDVVRADGESASDVCFREVPLGIACDLAYRESVGCVLEALMARAGFPGTVVLDADNASRGELRYRMRA